MGNKKNGAGSDNEMLENLRLLMANEIMKLEKVIR